MAEAETARDEGDDRIIRESGIDARIALIVGPVLRGIGYRLVRVRLLAQNGLTLQIMAEKPDGTMTVVSGSGWTFTAPLNEKTAARLPDGGSAVLLLPDETRVTAAVCITDAGEAVFSCGTHLESVLSLNECTLAVLLAEWEGYSVPESAVLPGEDGETVCRVSGPVREYVPVTVLARRGGAALIASPMLRGGMSVLLFPAADSEPS